MKSYPQLPLFARISESNGNPAASVIPPADHSAMKTLDDLLGALSSLQSI